MLSKRRSSSRAAPVFVALLLLVVRPAFAGPWSLDGLQPAQASALDRALRANDLEQARRLVPENWAESERLFVSYLERAYLSGDSRLPAPESRLLASRLADVFFCIVEYDFARSLVSTLDTADAARRRQLIAATRDLFSNLERRRTLPRSAPPPKDYNTLGLPIFRALAGVASSFRGLSFHRGELFALFCMADISPPVPRVHLLAKELGDDLSLVLAQRQSAGEENPPWEVLLQRAEHLRLPGTQSELLVAIGATRLMSARAGRASTSDLEESVKHLERARAVVRAIPALETVNYEWYTASTPQIVGIGMPQLFGAYVALKRLDAARQVLDEAVQLSQPFGEDALLNTVGAFALRAGGLLSWEEAKPLLQASQAIGRKAELRMARGLAGGGSTFRTEIADKALALAVALPDAGERGSTLTWYSSGRRSLAWTAKPAPAPPQALPPSSTNPAGFPALYRQLFEMSLESGEFEAAAEALAYQAEIQGRGGNVAGAQETFNEVIGIAGRSGDNGIVARFTVWAATGLAPRSSTVPPVMGKRWPPAVQLDFATRAVEAAKAADSPRELLMSFWARAMVPTAATNQRVTDLREAVAAAERYTEETGQPTNELRCLTQLAQEYGRRGEYLPAIDAERRRAERAHAFDARDDSESQAYFEMARIYATSLGEPSLALEAADRARQWVDTSRATSYRPPGATDTACTYHRLAALAADLGQPVDAIASWDKAVLALAEPGQEDALAVQVARRRILAERATTLGKLGDFQAALADWNEVLALLPSTARSFRFAESIQRAEWLAAVAWIHALQGDRDKALAETRRAVAEFKREDADRWLSQSVIASGLVSVELVVPNPEEAVVSFIGTIIDTLILTGHADEAIVFGDLETIRRQLAERPVARRMHLEHLAEACVAAGQLDRARTLLQSAMEIDRSYATAASGGLGGSLFQLGRLEFAAGNLATAKEHLLAARAAANPYDFNQVWRIERALALVLSRTGDGEAAAACYERALNALESVRERLRPEEFRLRYGGNRDEIYEAYASQLAVKALSSGRPADADLAFQAAERKRTQALWGLIATGWARIQRDTLPEQVRRLFDLESRIGAKQSLLREQFGQPADTRNGPLIDALQRDLELLQEDHSRLLTSVAQGQYRFAAPATLAASLAAPVRAALGPSRVLVEYLVTADRSFAFVVSASRLKVVSLPIGRDALRQRVRTLLQPFRQLRAGEIDLARLTFDARAAYDLQQAIFAPVRASLGAASELVVVPDDVLTFLPFDALIEQALRARARGAVLHAELAGEKFLLLRYTISHLSSAAQLLDRPGQRGPAAPAKGLFAMATPSAGHPGTPAAGQDNPLKRQVRTGVFDAYMTPLPGAESEVRRIARHFAREGADIVTGREATELAYEQRAGVSRIVHLATHAVASDSQPFYSTLVLAPDSAPGHDGLLQAFEVLRTPLLADLVVLSGCETALGAEDVGQGLVGLVAAFQQAGARQVVATLWSIDEVAAEIMANFYDAMAKGTSTPAALRQAKLQMLKQRLRIGQTDVSLAHPFFWAPFILVGAPAEPPAAR